MLVDALLPLELDPEENKDVLGALLDLLGVKNNEVFS